MKFVKMTTLKKLQSLIENNFLNDFSYKGKITSLFKWNRTCISWNSLWFPEKDSIILWQSIHRNRMQQFATFCSMFLLATSTGITFKFIVIEYGHVKDRYGFVVPLRPSPQKDMLACYQAFYQCQLFCCWCMEGYCITIQ